MKNERETIFLNALEANKEKLFRICSIYSKDQEDAKDLFQEVLFQVWRSMTSFKGNASLSTWMFKIALNVCLRFKSKHTKTENKFIRIDSMIFANLESEENNAEESEKLLHLRKCVKKLNEADKAVIALYLEGLAYREIATILGLSENNIAVKVKRIKSKLLNCIHKRI